MIWQKLKSILHIDTYGWIALSGLLICVLSGIILIIPYDVMHPYNSVTAILLLDTSGSLVRNLHYWSAQISFIFTLLHIYDHLKKSTETRIKNTRTWFILCLVVFIFGYEMLSGFILKGDVSGIQAHRIVATLLESVPFAGKMLRTAFAGSEDNLQVIYIQHVATATILLFIGIYDHVRTIWPKVKSFVLVLGILISMSMIFRAPLDPDDRYGIKGPWFFAGIQEMLHSSGYPVLIVLLFALLFFALMALPKLNTKFRKWVKRFLLTGSLLYLLLNVVVLFFRGENWQWLNWDDVIKKGRPLLIADPLNIFVRGDSVRWPENQKQEGCLLCHSVMKGLTSSHDPSVVGCYGCHNGDPFATRKSIAHRGMVGIPGDFSNVRYTCGSLNCHPGITDRMLNSLMTTQSGIIAVDKFVFGEAATPDGSFHVKELGHTPADTHLRNLCAGCHLGKEKVKTGNSSWIERGGGCNACHLHYNEEALAYMETVNTFSADLKKEIHPAIDLQVSNDRCMSCHSRSGRISLNYEGWNETREKTSPQPGDQRFKKLPDQRLLEYVQSDIHHQKGMACIDCHLSYEIMGDNGHHVHKEDAVKIQCVDCHPTGKVRTTKLNQLPDFESRMISALRNYAGENNVVLTANGQFPIVNTHVDSTGTVVLTGKLTGRKHVSKPASTKCYQGKGHDRLSCQSCHTSWVPQCIGCHNTFEKKSPGFDYLTGKPVKGVWVEFVGKSRAEPPVLGVNTKEGNQVVTAMPGMIMTIDHGSFTKNGSTSFHRLYAPASGHTTQREPRNCASCHTHPLALGYGRGELKYEISGNTGKWSFESLFMPNEKDKLPEDAWTGFLQEGKAPWSTRSTLRPFTIAEQKRILEVGACLVCHEENSNIMTLALKDYAHIRSRLSKHCILPE